MRDFLSGAYTAVWHPLTPHLTGIAKIAWVQVSASVVAAPILPGSSVNQIR